MSPANSRHFFSVPKSVDDQDDLLAARVSHCPPCLLKSCPEWEMSMFVAVKYRNRYFIAWKCIQKYHPEIRPDGDITRGSFLKRSDTKLIVSSALQWRHNEYVSVSNHQHLDCLFNRLFRLRSKKTSKLCVTGLSEGNSPVTGDSIWWRHQAWLCVDINWSL